MEILNTSLGTCVINLESILVQLESISKYNQVLESIEA